MPVWQIHHRLCVCVCVHLLPYATRETLEELGLVGYQIDTFSSEYDDYIDESGMVYDAHGA